MDNETPNSPSLDAMLSDADVSGSEQFNAEEFSQIQEDNNPRARDDSGRFKSQESEQEPQENQLEQSNDQLDDNLETGAKVPSHRLREEAEKRRRVEDELNATRQEMQQLRAIFAQTQQPKQEAQEVDFVEKILSDPIALIREQVRPVIEMTSRRAADQTHGKEKVAEAYKAIDTAIRNGQLNPSVADYLRTQSQDPYGEIVDWFDQSMPTRDPEAFKKQIIEEYKRETLASQNNQQQPRSVISLPPSINKVRSAAPMQTGAALQSEDDAMAFMRSVGNK